MKTYKLVNGLGGEVISILLNGALSIPFDQANTDYQAYLKWLAEGNTPLPPDQE